MLRQVYATNCRRTTENTICFKSAQKRGKKGIRVYTYLVRECWLEFCSVHCRPRSPHKACAAAQFFNHLCPNTMSIDVSNITHSIQLAVAPVFFLTGVAGMIGAVAGRLARIIDRGRVLEDRMMASKDEEYVKRSLLELNFLRRRGRLANLCIGLLTLCGALIALTIILLFIGQTTKTEIDANSWSLAAMFSFGLGVVSFVSALCCFMVETMMATRLLNFHPLRQPASVAGLATGKVHASPASSANASLRNSAADAGRQDAFVPQI